MTFHDDHFTLYQGNCLQVLKTLAPQSVDMVFADPPYNLSNGGFTVHNGKRTSVDKGNWDKSRGVEEDFAFHKRWMKACFRVLKPNGSFWVSGTYHSIYQCGFILQLMGARILNDISWYKPNASPNLSCRVFTASHENLIWARKNEKARHIFHYDDMKNSNFPEDKLKNSGKQMRSVWSIPTPAKSEKIQGRHPAQKPLKLLDRIITASTNKGDIILDPFTGSGTTAISAVRLGRNFIGIEQEQQYVDLTLNRYETLKTSHK